MRRIMNRKGRQKRFTEHFSADYSPLKILTLKIHQVRFQESGTVASY
jgi:hypothetical protein